MIKLSKLQLEIYEILKRNTNNTHRWPLALCGLLEKEKNQGVSFLDFFKNARGYKESGFAAVERCRRKLQEKFPELKDTKTAEKRFELMQDYEEYALKW